MASSEQHPEPAPRDAAWLREQYTANGRTLQDIAEELGCSHATVWDALKRHDIPRRRRGPASRFFT